MLAESSRRRDRKHRGFGGYERNKIYRGAEVKDKKED
jgi:ribosomal protein L44E